MKTLLERYLGGEYQEVWNDLHKLGAGVREADAAGDAMAVAQETVRRAKLNLESIIERLAGLGYRFATRDHKNDEPLRDPPKTTVKQLAAFERKLGGPVPLILAAWYQQIGAVSLMGSHPVFCPRTPAGSAVRPSGAQLWSIKDQVSADPFVMDPFDPSSFDHFRSASDPSRRRTLAEARLRDFDETLARTRAAIAEKFPDVFAQTENRLRPEREKLLQAIRDAAQPVVFQMALGPDDIVKFGESGDSYYVALPDAGADFVIRTTGPEVTFVDYLRRSFRCGGFAGWDGHPNAPPELLTLGSTLLPV